LSTQVLREFKRFHGDVGCLIVAAAGGVQRQPQPGFSVSQFGLLAGEGVGVDLVVQPQVD
jgi:hypothetical protein